MTSPAGSISTPRLSPSIANYTTNTSCHWKLRPFVGANGQSWHKTTVFRADRVLLRHFEDWCADRLTIRSGNTLYVYISKPLM